MALQGTPLHGTALHGTARHAWPIETSWSSSGAIITAFES
jgi:hypothetical protein